MIPDDGLWFVRGNQKLRGLMLSLREILMIFRQLYDTDSSTYTYLLADASQGAAVIIDPVQAQCNVYLTMLSELHLTLKWILGTHVHADHITGPACCVRPLPPRLL